jgi:hypothetical protein
VRLSHISPLRDLCHGSRGQVERGEEAGAVTGCIHEEERVAGRGGRADVAASTRSQRSEPAAAQGDLVELGIGLGGMLPGGPSPSERVVGEEGLPPIQADGHLGVEALLGPYAHRGGTCLPVPLEEQGVALLRSEGGEHQPLPVGSGSHARGLDPWWEVEPTDLMAVHLEQQPVSPLTKERVAQLPPGARVAPHGPSWRIAREGEYACQECDPRQVEGSQVPPVNSQFGSHEGPSPCGGLMAQGSSILWRHSVLVGYKALFLALGNGKPFGGSRCHLGARVSRPPRL